MIRKIVSGGQTGVDRAGLDYAIEAGIAHGGYCPKGRRCENGRGKGDGRIPDKYQLTESSSREYPQRTLLNVIHSDGTLIITRGRPTGGTGKTVGICRARNQTPPFIVDLNEQLKPAEFRDWVLQYGVATVNIAGPRESKQPGIYKAARRALRELFAALQA